MSNNARFGVSNAHIALLTDEDALTYETPVPVPGAVAVSIEVETGASACYADNDVWAEKEKDDTGTGTLSFRDMESDKTVRKLFADIIGAELDSTGRMFFTGQEPKPFAFMCEQSGVKAGTRLCLMRCRAQKPKDDLKTSENGEVDFTQVDIPIEWRRVTLADGKKLSRYKDYPENESYATFFKQVLTEVSPAAAAVHTAPKSK